MKELIKNIAKSEVFPLKDQESQHVGPVSLNDLHLSLKYCHSVPSSFSEKHTESAPG